MGKPEPIYLHTIEDLFNFIEKSNKEYEEKKGRKIMSKEKTHEVKESRIKELAKECPEYRKAMQVLFPEALKPEGFCCTIFEHGLYGGKGGHAKMVFDASAGEYYNYPDAVGWKLKYCPSCGAKYDGKKWEARKDE